MHKRLIQHLAYKSERRISRATCIRYTCDMTKICSHLDRFYRSHMSPNHGADDDELRMKMKKIAIN